ncbi:unnamed protein product, partial [Meganyctiphanes norvegica]
MFEMIITQKLLQLPECVLALMSRTHMPGRIQILSGMAGPHLVATAVALWLLHSNIDYVERRQQGMTGGTLWLKMKDFRILQVDIIGADQFSKVADTLDDLVRVEEPLLQYPFFYRPMYTVLEDGWGAFNPETEFSRLVQPGDDWRISYVNKDFKVCPSYPCAVVVPKSIEDSDLVAISNFRQGGRFPVLTYRHEGSAVLLRSSQPQLSPNGKRCKEDERLLNCVLARDKRGYIIDTRSQNLTQSAKLRGGGGGGGGYEPELHYPNWRRVHKPIDRHHILLDSLAKLMEGVNDVNSGMDKWLSRLESSGWMNNIKETLNVACLVAQCLDQEGASVLVHDTDGVDSTLQITSLSQIILNADCRTVRGFEALIEREWIQAGYPFATRHSRSCYTPSSQRSSKNNSPSFLLFLDCVYQIYTQFSCSFEFGENFLLMLFEHSYSSQFGTFLGNNEGDRRRLKASERTTSLWSFINRPEVLPQYLNSMYEPNTSVIWPSVAPMSLQLWNSVYLRWVVDQAPQEAAWSVVRELRERDQASRSRVARLRRQLADLEREAVAAGILTSPATNNVL